MSGSGYPTNLQYGISTVPRQQPLGNYPLPDPFHTSSADGIDSHSYVQDFNTLAGTDFALTGTGTPTFALGSGVGGVAVLTTTATSGDSALATKNGNAFSFTAGQKAWGLFRFMLADATTPSFLVGLVNAASQTDGLYFVKAAGSTTVSLVSMVGSAATTLVANVTTAANSVFLDLGWYYDQHGDLIVYSSDVVVARVTAAALTSAILTVGMQIVNGGAAAKSMTLDYVFAADEVVR